MTDRSIRFRGAALSDLDGIAQYTFQTFGALAMRVYLNELERCFTAISRHPELGVRFIKNVRRFAVGQHWIYYSSSTSSVRIIRILPQKALQVLREPLVIYGPLTKEHSELKPEVTSSELLVTQAQPEPAPRPALSALEALEAFRTFAPHG